MLTDIFSEWLMVFMDIALEVYLRPAHDCTRLIVVKLFDCFKNRGDNYTN